MDLTQLSLGSSVIVGWLNFWVALRQSKSPSLSKDSNIDRKTTRKYGLILGAVLSGLVTAFSLYSWYWATHMAPISHYVVSQKFLNETVPLDTYSYSDCDFTNVTFEFKGTGAFTFSGNRIHLSFQFHALDPAITAAMKFLKAAGMVSPNMPIRDDNWNVYDPHTTVEPEK